MHYVTLIPLYLNNIKDLLAGVRGNRIHFDRYRQLLEAIKTPYFSMVCGGSSNC